MAGGMDWGSIGSFGLNTGGGGLSGGSTGQTSASSSMGSLDFGGMGTASYNFGSGSSSATGAPKTNWTMIAVVAGVALVAVMLLKKK